MDENDQLIGELAKKYGAEWSSTGCGFDGRDMMFDCPNKKAAHAFETAIKDAFYANFKTGEPYMIEHTNVGWEPKSTVVYLAWNRDWSELRSYLWNDKIKRQGRK